MTEMNKINEEALGEVFGGEMRAIKNSSLGYVNIREEPGEDSTIVAKVNNGEMVETTGETCKKGGYVWYRVHLASGSDDAWVAGSLIDY